MRIDPESYRRSLAGPPSRSSRWVTDLAEWRQARHVATALRKSCAGRAWFLSAVAALDRRGRPVVRVYLRWTPDNLPNVLPVRWDGVPVFLRQPSGRDLDMRDVVKPKGDRRDSEAARGPGDEASHGVPGALVLQFPPARGKRS